MKKYGSATVIVIICAVVFMLYSTSTYADVRHLKKQYDKYEQNIILRYETEYNNITREL